MSSLHVRESFTRRVLEVIALNFWDTELVSMDNYRASPPAEKDWIVIEYLGADENQITTGAPSDNVFREVGDLLIHYVVPSDSGDEIVLARLDIIQQFFRATLVDEITINAVQPPDTQQGASLASAKGNWWGGSILINYQIDCRG
jgi:hypothetical protein